MGDDRFRFDGGRAAVCEEAFISVCSRLLRIVITRLTFVKLSVKSLVSAATMHTGALGRFIEKGPIDAENLRQIRHSYG